MKILLTFFVLLFSSSVVAYEEMYYCSDIDSGGFNNEGKGYELILITLKNFKIKIDLSEKTIDSLDLKMSKGKVSEAKCQSTSNGQYLSCNNALGRLFTINTRTLRYTFASTYGHISGDKDSIWVAYGTCEKF